MKLEHLEEAGRLSEILNKLKTFNQNIPKDCDSLTITLRRGNERGGSSSISIPLDLQLIDTKRLLESIEINIMNHLTIYGVEIE